MSFETDEERGLSTVRGGVKRRNTIDKIYYFANSYQCVTIGVIIILKKQIIEKTVVRASRILSTRISLSYSWSNCIVLVDLYKNKEFVGITRIRYRKKWLTRESESTGKVKTYSLHSLNTRALIQHIAINSAYCRSKSSKVYNRDSHAIHVHTPTHVSRNIFSLCFI